MGSNQNGDVHGRLSKILNTLREISETLSPSSVEDNSRIDSVFSAIESSVFELHDLVVGKRDKDTSKDSGNTSFTEVRFVYIEQPVSSRLQTKSACEIFTTGLFVFNTAVVCSLCFTLAVKRKSGKEKYVT